jgi:hypothetical protein
MIHIDISTVENVWSRKIRYLRIDKTPMKLGSVFRIESTNIKKTKSNWPLLSSIKINLGKINRLHYDGGCCTQIELMRQQTR